MPGPVVTRRRLAQSGGREGGEGGGGRPPEPVAGDVEVGQDLGRIAPFADKVDDGAPPIDALQEIRRCVRIDIVDEMEPGMLGWAREDSGQIGPKRLDPRPSAQPRPAVPRQDVVAASPPKIPAFAERRVGTPVRKIQVGELAARAPPGEVLMGRRRPPLEAGEVPRPHAGRPNRPLHHEAKIELHRRPTLLQTFPACKRGALFERRPPAPLPGVGNPPAKLSPAELCSACCGWVWVWLIQLFLASLFVRMPVCLRHLRVFGSRSIRPRGQFLAIACGPERAARYRATKVFEGGSQPLGGVQGDSFQNVPPGLSSQTRSCTRPRV